MADVAILNGYNIKDATARQMISELDKNNFGDLAFKNSATGSYTPAGSVSISGGTLPTLTYDSTNESLTFSQGAFPSSGTFSGTAASITVS